MHKVIIPLFVLALFLLSACSSNKAAPVEKNAGFYFLEGEEFYEKGQYKEAIGEAETIKQLEKAAKLLPEKRKERKK